EPTEAELAYECLLKCMEQLPPANRKLISGYYQNDKRQKVESRKNLAETLGIAQNALRIRAHRIRQTLQHCVEECLEQSAPA
ncbi:MAG TPA: hypothetical protein VJ715_11735, partial [Pyrinomonadaceae bacterium]|nr:hypothetical protein [Pyrinomonadaceae bacterium]